MTGRKLLFPALLLYASPAVAQVPQPVEEMIQAAIATGDEDTVTTVISIAKATNPDDSAALDKVLADFLAAQRAEMQQVAAQEEAEIRQAGLLDNWSGEGQIGAFQASGNTDSVGGTASLSLQRDGINWSHRLFASADYQRTNGATSSEQMTLRYEPRVQLTEGLFAYGLAQFERDRFQGFSTRYSTSGGLGYRIVNNDNLHLSVKAGPAFRRTNFSSGESQSELAGLIGVDFDWRLSDTIKLTQDTNAVAEGGSEAVAFVSAVNTSISVITGLEAKLGGDLTARLAYSVDYESSPPPGFESTDTMTRFTLIYGF